jgi:hypothetical protein
MIGLPLLEFTHGEAWAQSRQTPQRFVVFFDHGGTLSPVQKNGTRDDGTHNQCGFDGWSPASPGEILQPGTIHSVLQTHLDKLLLLRGIDNRSARVQAPSDGDHGWNNATAMTCSNARVTGTISEALKSALAPSFDQILATRLAQRQPVPFESIHLMLDGTTYGTPFYRDSMQPVAPQLDPVAAFDTMFASVNEASSGEDPAGVRARALKRSILDGTGDMVKTFQKRLGTTDRQTLDAHLDHVRTLEQRVAALALPMVPGCQKPTLTSPFASKGDIAEAHVDVMAAALRCGLTNVACFEIGDIETLWLNPAWVNPQGLAHMNDHMIATTGPTGVDHASLPTWLPAMIQNRSWRMSLFGRLMDALGSAPEGSGTMLDHSLLYYTSDFSNPSLHSAADVPVLLAGGVSGQFRMGRHLNFNLKAAADPTTSDYETRSSLHNLYTSILNAFDYPDTSFGNQDAYVQGPLAGLT